MKTYHITWEIDIDAETPREAAEQALEIQRDANSLATVFSVKEFDSDDDATQIDLLDTAE